MRVQLCLDRFLWSFHSPHDRVHADWENRVISDLVDLLPQRADRRLDGRAQDEAEALAARQQRCVRRALLLCRHLCHVQAGHNIDAYKKNKASFFVVGKESNVKKKKWRNDENNTFCVFLHCSVKLNGNYIPYTMYPIPYYHIYTTWKKN